MVRNGIHILDLTQTVPMLDAALNAIRETVAKGGRVARWNKTSGSAADCRSCRKCAQYYMNHRYYGTLTNWQPYQSINRLAAIEEKLATGADGMTKKERLGIEREFGKLQASLAGSVKWAACLICCSLST